jgi:glycosyltransferase involved in cell wall biosynthesis
LKTLIVIPQIYKLGGAEKLALELAENLNRSMNKADLLLLYKDINENAQENEVSNEIENIYKLNLNVNPTIFDLIKSIRKVRNIIVKNSYDIIETSEITSSLIISIALKLISKPIYHIFGVHQHYHSSIGNKYKYLIWRIILKSNNRIHFYGVSEYVTTQWIKYLNISPENITTIYNSISDTFFDNKYDKVFVRKKLGIPINDSVLIFVGRLIVFKGFQNILFALASDLLKYKIHIVYLGSLDPDNLRGSNEIETLKILDQLNLIIKSNKLESNVHFLGHRSNVAEIMSSADILVHPTQHESFGLVLVEALALRLLIVASNVEGIPEVLSNTNSILIKPNDLDDLRKAIFSLLNSSQNEKNIFKKNGYDRANFFRSSYRTNQMLKLYTKLKS